MIFVGQTFKRKLYEENMNHVYYNNIFRVTSVNIARNYVIMTRVNPDKERSWVNSLQSRYEEFLTRWEEIPSPSEIFKEVISS